jgi:FkbM family methyltransferase
MTSSDNIGSGTNFFKSREAVFTHHGTVLYIDNMSGELRHGLPQNSPSNVILVREGPCAQIRFVGTEGQKNIAFLPEFAAVVGSEKLRNDEAGIAAHTVLAWVSSYGKAFGLTKDGQFLSALPSGSLKFNAPHFKDWERFHIRNDTSELSGTIVSQRIDGQIIHFFITNRKDWIQLHQSRGEFYEREGLDVIRDYCLPERIFVDIGANIGNHAVFVSKYCSVAELIVFEPNPVAIKILQTNLSLNACLNVNTSYLGFALGSQSKKTRLLMPCENNMGGGEVQEDPRGAIQCIPGDEVLLSKPVGFLKIDVEGMEFEVLGGLRKTIERWHPHMYIEVKGENLDQFRAWCEQFHYEIRKALPYDNYLLVSSQYEQ